MKICVLQPDYTGSEVDYRNFDPPRNLSALLPGHQVDHLFLRKAIAYRQLREAAKRDYDIFVNLCEGYLDWDVPSIDVIWSLEALNLPYTGPPARLYDPSKPLMKYVAATEGVRFPPFAEDAGTAIRQLRFPLFVKPAHAGDSLGIDATSLCPDAEALHEKSGQLSRPYGSILIEEFIDGREFTVLVAADAANPFTPRTFAPLEFVFSPDERFKTYSLKVATHRPESNVPVDDPAIAGALRSSAAKIFLGFEGEGYARLDFRMNERGELFFLDINFTCSVFYPVGYEGSADYILRHDATGPAGFLRHIIAEGIARHRRKQNLFAVRPHGLAGFGIQATRDVAKGEIVFRGEERPYRLATAMHIDSHWSAGRIEIFRRYARPAGPDIYMLWDADPANWAPQNHSCDANTAYEGLDVIAVRDIREGEELTIDYGTFAHPLMPEFECNCGAHNCRRMIP